MSKTIAQLKTSITNKLHGTTLNQIGDFYTLCRDVAEIVGPRIDIQETRRRALIPNAVYDMVNDYSLPTDFKAPIDISPQARKYYYDNSSLNRTYSRQFSNQKQNNQFAIVWRDTVQFLRYAKALKAPALIDRADSLTENGNWTIGGNASDLTLDTQNFVAGTGSLKASVSSPGTLVNLVLRIGNDSSNYYEKTITTPQFGEFVDGWNLSRFTLSDASLTGSVDMSAIDYVRVLVTYNTNQTAYFEKTLNTSVDLSGNYKTDGAIFLYFFFDSIASLNTIRLDNITANIGSFYYIDYYSNYLFRNSSGTWIEEPTSDTDILNLSPVSYKIFEAEMCRQITQENQGAMGGFDYAFWTELLEGNPSRGIEGLYDQYGDLYPSERIDGETDYYDTSGELDFNDNYTINGEPQSYWN